MSVSCRYGFLHYRPSGLPSFTLSGAALTTIQTPGGQLCGRQSSCTTGLSACRCVALGQNPSTQILVSPAIRGILISNIPFLPLAKRCFRQCWLIATLQGALYRQIAGVASSVVFTLPIKVEVKVKAAIHGDGTVCSMQSDSHSVIDYY